MSTLELPPEHQPPRRFRDFERLAEKRRKRVQLVVAFVLWIVAMVLLAQRLRGGL